MAHIQTDLPGFHADFMASLHRSDLRGVLKDLQRMHAELKGRAELNALEGFLELTAEMDGLGHIHWSISLNYPAGYGARLNFEIENDQTYLPELIGELEEVLDSFPAN